LTFHSWSPDIYIKFIHRLAILTYAVKIMTSVSLVAANTTFTHFP